MANEMPRPTSPAHPTRQQLDELEALMQRMLALPVNPAEAEAEDRAGAGSPSSPASESAAQPAASIPAAMGTAPALQTAIREPGPALTSAAPVVPPRPSAPEPRRANRPPRRLRPPPALVPVVWLNAVFELWVGRLGRPGRWLASPAGRTVLGWLGLLCLAGTAAWVIFDRVGWTW